MTIVLSGNKKLCQAVFLIPANSYWYMVKKIDLGAMWVGKDH